MLIQLFLKNTVFPCGIIHFVKLDNWILSSSYYVSRTFCSIAECAHFFALRCGDPASRSPANPNPGGMVTILTHQEPLDDPRVTATIDKLLNVGVDVTTARDFQARWQAHTWRETGEEGKGTELGQFLIDLGVVISKGRVSGEKVLRSFLHYLMIINGLTDKWSLKFTINYYQSCLE